MDERPSAQQIRLAVIIFVVIVAAGLAITVFFMSDATEEIEGGEPAQQEEEVIGQSSDRLNDAVRLDSSTNAANLRLL